MLLTLHTNINQLKFYDYGRRNYIQDKDVGEAAHL